MNQEERLKEICRKLQEMNDEEFVMEIPLTEENEEETDAEETV